MTDRIRVKELNPAQERDMEKEIIFLIEEAPEGGYVARALGHNIFTEADSFAELKKMVQDATQCHFEAEEMPRVIRLHMVKDEVISV
jgi:predicted RNase H-like HicB family nuclease